MHNPDHALSHHPGEWSWLTTPKCGAPAGGPRSGAILTANVLLAGTYYAAGSLGQILAIPPGNVTLVWPPSGIALAVLLLGGDRLWPGIWLGAFLVNVRTLFDLDPQPRRLPPLLAAGAAIATGSTVQALVGSRLIDYLAGGRSFLDQARGVFRFAAGAMLMCLISSTVGATSLALGGFIPWDAHGLVWRTWWLGDLAGVLVFTPLLLAWLRRLRSAGTPGCSPKPRPSPGCCRPRPWPSSGAGCPPGPRRPTDLPDPDLGGVPLRTARDHGGDLLRGRHGQLEHGAGVRPIPGRDAPDEPLAAPALRVRAGVVDH